MLLVRPTCPHLSNHPSTSLVTRQWVQGYTGMHPAWFAGAYVEAIMGLLTDACLTEYVTSLYLCYIKRDIIYSIPANGMSVTMALKLFHKGTRPLYGFKVSCMVMYFTHTHTHTLYFISGSVLAIVL